MTTEKLYQAIKESTRVMKFNTTLSVNEKINYRSLFKHTINRNYLPYI